MKNNFQIDYIIAFNQSWDDTVAIGIVGNKDGDPRNRQYFNGKEYIDIGVGARYEPAYLITNEAAQRLANSLWDAGIRPVGAKGSVGQLEAVNKHLEDMRSIVFKNPLPRDRDC